MTGFFVGALTSIFDSPKHMLIGGILRAVVIWVVSRLHLQIALWRARRTGYG